MQNKLKLLLLGAVGLLGLTGCKLDEKDYIRDLQNVVMQKLATNQEISSKADVENISYLFTKYQINDAENGLDVDIYGKLSDGKNYKSYIKLSYDGVDKSFVDEKKLADPNRPYYQYDALRDIVKYNSDYTIENTQVEDFEKLDKTIKNFTPKTHSGRYEYKLDDVEILSFDNFNYDMTSETFSLKSDALAKYSYEESSLIVITEMVYPVVNTYTEQIKYQFEIECHISQEEYSLHNGDKKYMLSRFTEYVENKQEDNYLVNLRDSLTIKSLKQTQENKPEENLEL